MEVSGWVGPLFHSDFFGKSSQNSRNPVLIFWSSRSYTMCNLFVYTCTLLKVVSYHFECSVHVSDGFQKESLDGLRMSSIQFYFGFLTLMQSP